MNLFNEELNSIRRDIAFSQALGSSVSNELSNAHAALMRDLASNPPAEVPDRATLLGWLRNVCPKDSTARAAVEREIRRMEMEPAERTFSALRSAGERLATPLERTGRGIASLLPSRRSDEPAEQAAPAGPARRSRISPPSISQLRNQGYSNILDVRVDEETVLRFASNEPNLDLIGMNYSQMVEYAKNNPGSMRIFAVDDRGRATREMRPSSL